MRLKDRQGQRIGDLGDKYLDIIVGKARERIRSCEELILEANREKENLPENIVQPDNLMLDIFGVLKENIIVDTIYEDSEITNKDYSAGMLIEDVYKHLLECFPKNNHDYCSEQANKWIIERKDLLGKKGLYDPKERETGTLINRKITDYIVSLTDRELYDIWSQIYINKAITPFTSTK